METNILSGYWKKITFDINQALMKVLNDAYIIMSHLTWCAFNTHYGDR